MASGVAAFLVLSRLSGSAAGALLHPSDRIVVSLGSEIYAEHCASCHGRSLEGHPEWQVRDAEGYLPAPPHDETGHTWHHPDKLLFDITAWRRPQSWRVAGCFSPDHCRRCRAVLSETRLMPSPDHLHDRAPGCGIIRAIGHRWT